MGKTMVSISLILANPLAGGDKPTAAECRKPVDESDDEGFGAVHVVVGDLARTVEDM